MGKITMATAVALLTALTVLSGCSPANKATRGADFLKGKVVEMSSVSTQVNQGEVTFLAYSKPDAIKILLSGTIMVVDNTECDLCVETVHIAANLRVPSILFQDHKNQNPPYQEAISPSFTRGFENLEGEAKIPKPATEFIVASPQGATLKKVGKGFMLVSGDAHIELEKH